MNQNVASYPSVLGVPDCIEERVNFDASLAKVVGSSARWSSYESRYQSGIVTGSAFLTPELRAWRENHESTFVSLALGRAFRCTLTQWEPRADSQGRAIVSYASLLVETYYLPRPEDLVCMYVPQWQTDTTLIQDFSGNDRNLVIRRGGIVAGVAVDCYAQSNTFAVDTIMSATVLIKRALSSLRVGEQYSGLSLTYTNNQNVIISELCNSRNYINQRVAMLGGGDDIVNGFAETNEVYITTHCYNGTQTITPGTRTQYHRIALNIRADSLLRGLLYTQVWYVAVWRRDLTEHEIFAARRYLSQPTRPS